MDDREIALKIELGYSPACLYQERRIPYYNYSVAKENLNKMKQFFGFITMSGTQIVLVIDGIIIPREEYQIIWS